MKEYWIILGAERQVEVYRRPELGQYRERHVCRLDDVLESVAIPGVQLPVAELFG